MKKLTNKKITTALVMAALFTTMQVASATELGFESGIGKLNSAEGGFQEISTVGNVTRLRVNGDTYCNWETLNVLKDQTWNIYGNETATVLNTVNTGMSTFAGTVNSNVGKLIISNPNGMLFDGAKFTATGDLVLSTQDMRGMSLEDLSNAKFTQLYDAEGKLIPVAMKNATFEVSGDYTILAPMVNAEASKITANNFKIITANGADYAALGQAVPVNNKGVTFLKAMEINGDVYIANPEGAMSISDGGTINGNLNVETKGNTFVNYHNESGKRLAVNGDADVKSHGQWSLLRNTDIKGNLKMSNDGGFVDVGNANIKGNANLTTTGIAKNNNDAYNHYVHVIGNTNIDGNLTIEASENIHIGGYDYDAQRLADGKLTVGGDLYAHATDGHITTTIDTSAENITYISDNYNILTDGEAVLSAKTYNFSANGYIGGIKDYTNKNGTTISNDSQIVDIMENYKHIPADISSHDYLNIAGGEIKNIATNETGEVYIKSNGDVLLTGADAHNINIVAPDKYIHITGPDVYADNINVGKETHTVEVDFPGRNFTLNYTNIRDNQLTTVRPDEVITYELTNEPTNGYNAGTHTADNTFLVGPNKTIDPQPEPQPEPGPAPEDEPERHLQWVPEDAMKAPVDTPVAFAADLDDDEDGTPIRKNVDGSVTVVKKVAAY